MWVLFPCTACSCAFYYTRFCNKVVTCLKPFIIVSSFCASATISSVLWKVTSSWKDVLNGAFKKVYISTYICFMYPCWITGLYRPYAEIFTGIIVHLYDSYATFFSLFALTEKLGHIKLDKIPLVLFSVDLKSIIWTLCKNKAAIVLSVGGWDDNSKLFFHAYEWFQLFLFVLYHTCD